MLLDSYRKKVEGCWLGKNIGGTLGAPLEGKRGVTEVSCYLQNLSEGALPNDDLDLQLIWLNAAEKYKDKLNASILGEYWNFYIIPNWGEYGAGKNNMRMGILPPLSGHVNNIYGQSCGAFIRSEIWACLAPGNPDISVHYAWEDAVVDHFGEGIYAEIFCAAMQSAAFVQDDLQTLIDIGLSYIPKDCGIAKAVESVRQSFSQKRTWQEARKDLLIRVPGSFGALCTPPKERDDMPVGEIGWDAPSNIGIVVLALLYGEKQFGKSVCIAASCGEDADCTAATVGALLGIILEKEGMEPEWLEPIGDVINTMCLNICDQGVIIPKTVTELTERILRAAPCFLGSERCDVLQKEGGYGIKTLEGERLFLQSVRVNAWQDWDFSIQLKQSPYVVACDFPLFKVYVDYGKDPFIQKNEPFLFKIRVENCFYQQQWVNLHWHLPEAISVGPHKEQVFSLEQNHCNFGFFETEFSLTLLPEASNCRYEAVLEISSHGHHTKGFIPIVLLVK